MIQKNKNRNLNIDILRVICSIFIVIIHIIDFYILSYNDVGEIFWQFINLFESIIRFAVPIFFMISGALLIKNINEDYKSFYKKRLLKIVVPYILISIIYSIGNQILKIKSIYIETIISNIVNFNAHYHLWFFKPLIIIYLITPVIRVVVKYLESNNKRYVINLYLLVWTIFGVILPTLINVYNFNSIRYGVETINYLGYFILGYAISNYYKNLFKGKEYIFICTYGISVLLTFLGNSVYLDRHNGVYNNYFIYPITFNIYIQAVSIFMYFNIKNIKLSKNKQLIINNIGACSIYIYLLHPIFILIVKDFININLFTGNMYVKCFLFIGIVNIFTVFTSIITSKVLSYIKLIYKTLNIKYYKFRDNNLVN